MSVTGVDGAQPWQLCVKDLVGTTTTVSVRNPQDLTVLGLKQLIHKQRPDLPPHRQKLVCRSCGPRPLEDDRKLSSFPGLQDKSVINIIVQLPWEIYLQAGDGKLHTVEVPSSTPNDYLVADLRSLSERICKLSLNDYQFCLGQKVVEDSRHGKMLTLGDNGIAARDTLVLLKVGFALNITNPKVDLCFLVDCTMSMKSWIRAVKGNIVQLCDKLEVEYQGCDLQFAFVGYTDYVQPASTRTSWIGFTKSALDFRSFVSGIATKYGGDGPEDVMGGLQAVFSHLCWRQDSSKVLIHIADYPCHGLQYHGTHMHDYYPDGDPVGISHEDMMQKVAQNQVQYWFGYINKEYTEKMISVFNESLRRLSGQRLMIRQFDTKDPKEMAAAVYKSITASVVGSEAHKVASAESWSLDPTVPNWETRPELNALKVQLPDVLSLADLQKQEVSLPNPSVPFHFRRAANPFTVGEETVVFHAIETRTNRRVVLKEMHTTQGGGNALQACKRTAEMQIVASAYAREFSEEDRKPHSTPNVAYTGCDVIQCPNGKCYLVEQLLDGTFEKFGNNFGIVRHSGSPVSNVLQTFSHYTWVKSRQSILVCDLQGVQTVGGVTLTDPAIHSNGAGGKYGATDQGRKGVQKFFKTHSCNDICQRMNLRARI